MTRDTLGRLSSIVGPSVPENLGSTRTALASYTWMGPRPWERTHANFTETRYWDTHDGTVKPLYDPLGRLLGVRTTDEGTGTNLGDFAGFLHGWDRVLEDDPPAAPSSRSSDARLPRSSLGQSTVFNSGQSRA